MTMRTALGTAVIEDASSLSHPRHQGVAVAVHSFLARDPGVFTGSAAQAESTSRGQVAVHSWARWHRACNARQGRRLRLRDRAACDQRLHSELTSAVHPDPALQSPSPNPAEGSAPVRKGTTE
jgi:hypothetical protein